MPTLINEGESMEAEIAKKLMQQHVDSARAMWESGQLPDFMAGYHCGAIAGLSHSVVSAADCDFAHKAADQVHNMKINPKAKEAA